MQFGDQLKALRLSKSLTQKELASMIGVSDRVLGYYESNDRFPKDECVLKQLADIFCISMDELLMYKPQQAAPLPYEQTLEQLKCYFMDASDADKDLIFNDLSTLYFESKQINQQKYNPHKNKK